MTNKALDLRLQQLERNVYETSVLIGQYETELTLEDDPKRKKRYELRINELNKLLTDFREQLANLKDEDSFNQDFTSRVDTVNDGLQSMQSQLEALGNLILNSHKALIKELDRNQLDTLQIIQDALEANRIPEVELENLLNSVQHTLETAEKKGLAISPAQKEIERVVNDPSMEAKHRLKVSIPIIPLLLDYETELEMGTEFGLKTLWERLKNRFQGI